MQNLGQIDYFAVFTILEMFPFKDIYAISAHLQALANKTRKDDLPKLQH